MPNTSRLLSVTAIAISASATALAGHPASVHAVTVSPPPHRTLPPPGDFVASVDNRWFPLRPGTVLTYKGESDGTPATDIFRVTHRTKTIQGIKATVVDDRVYTQGRLSERTSDWYAQDKVGNVWYLGEDTATLNPDGTIDSTEGSWQAGVRGALAGIFMPARPRVGQTGEQEYSPGQARDQFKILRLHVTVHTPGASSRNAMLVQETTPLEPGVVDHKLYIRGVGTVREETIKGGNERFQLVSIRRAG